ncbi:dimethylarginine dimethylaminohydrolase 2 [Roseibium sp. TrichSKD4]|nr:dimethylarginine dimethylaminohydrolase 2 [Roseibium sp. TrichSKD4]
MVGRVDPPCPSCRMIVCIMHIGRSHCVLPLFSPWIARAFSPRSN